MFFDVVDSTFMKAKGEGNATKRQAVADTIREWSHALQCAEGFGLDAYIPAHKLKPGCELTLVPAEVERRHVLKLMIDEGTVGVCAANFLSSRGLRVFYDRDVCHRKNTFQTMPSSAVDYGVNMSKSTNIFFC